MIEKCTHATSIQIATFSDETGQLYTVNRCQWNCGKLFIQWTPLGEVVTKTEEIQPELLPGPAICPYCKNAMIEDSDFIWQCAECANAQQLDAPPQA